MNKEDIKSIVKALVNYRQLNINWWQDIHKTTDRLLDFIGKPNIEVTPSKSNNSQETMFLDLNSVLVRFWKERGRPSKEIQIELLERMLHWYKTMGTITMDKGDISQLPTTKVVGFLAVLS